MPKLPKKKKPKPSESFPAYINAESIAKTLIGDAVNELHEEPVVDWETVKDGIELSKPESPWLIPAEFDLSGWGFKTTQIIQWPNVTLWTTDYTDSQVISHIVNYATHPYYDPKPFQCPHCLRHRHPGPLTQRQAQMIDLHRMDPNYRRSEDGTPLVCVGSDYEGPIPRTRSEAEVQWSKVIDGYTLKDLEDFAGMKWVGNINKEDMKNLTVEVVE